MTPEHSISRRPLIMSGQSSVSRVRPIISAKAVRSVQRSNKSGILNTAQQVWNFTQKILKEQDQGQDQDQDTDPDTENPENTEHTDTKQRIVEELDVQTETNKLVRILNQKVDISDLLSLDLKSDYNSDSKEDKTAEGSKGKTPVISESKDSMESLGHLMELEIQSLKTDRSKLLKDALVEKIKILGYFK